jgi:alpha-methylacyl-CoA racemase
MTQKATSSAQVESAGAGRNGSRDASGPLAGLRVLEFASIGPGPHCAMLLSDLGAEVLRIERAGGNGWENPIVDRGRHHLHLDIRQDSGRDLCLAAAQKADVLIEGLRPGVMERLGLGPQEMCAANSRLIYARLTGWGQEGPRSQIAGHDINYIAITGALAAIGRAGEPAIPPLNLVGDFGGGSMFAAFGILAALWERQRSGRGQIVDAAMVDGVASLMSMFSGLLPRGAISMDRRENVLGGAAPFYRCYTCSDGRDISVGALEPRFYALLIERIGAPESFREAQDDSRNWPERAAVLAQIFAQKTRDEWAAVFANLDACVAPVLSLQEAFEETHQRVRGTYVETGDGVQCSPAPRFSRTPGRIQPTGSAESLLAQWGVPMPETLRQS